MGNACCLSTSVCEEHVDETKGLLRGPNKGTVTSGKAREDEADGKQTDLEKNGGEPNENSTKEWSRNADGELDTGVTDLKPDVCAEVRTVNTIQDETRCPEKSSTKADDEQTPNPTYKTEQQNVSEVTTKIEDGHVEDSSPKTDDRHVEPSKAQDLVIDQPTLKAEGGLLKASSPKSESVQTKDPSLETKSEEDKEPSLVTKSARAEDPSPKSGSVQVEFPSPKIEHVQENGTVSKASDLKVEDELPTAVNGPATDLSLTSHVGKSSFTQEPQSNTDPTEVVPDPASPQSDQKMPLENHFRLADGGGAEIAAAALCLDGKPEPVDHDSGGHALGAVSSSAQAKMPEIEDQVAFSQRNTADGDTAEHPEARVIGLSEVPSLEDIVQEAEEEAKVDVGQEEEEEKGEEEEEEEEGTFKMPVASGKGEKMEQESNAEAQEECTTQGGPLLIEVKVEPVICPDGTAGEELSTSDDDLYRGADEIAKERSEQNKVEPLIQITLPGVQDRSSVAPAINILSYSQREWKGNTAKSALIKKGYAELSQSFGDVRRVRGDNYCALRATLFQVLSQSDAVPSWLQKDDITLLPEKLVAEKELIESWRFPLEHGEENKTGGAIEQLKHCLELMQKTWQAAAEAGSEEERQRLCEQVFQGGEEEYALLEALKLLMLSAAVELHARMQQGDDVPVFCWLLFARDSSTCPRTFLANHLSHVGFSGGLEQVEMFLLGYTLQKTIKVYRLYMADTEEFITYYPDDHKEDWPHVCLVTEDDRHYNVPAAKLEGRNPPEAPTLD